jgi:hypothetical protein
MIKVTLAASTEPPLDLLCAVREGIAAAEMNDYSGGGGVCISSQQHLLQLSAPATILFAPFTIVISPDGGGALAVQNLLNELA